MTCFYFKVSWVLRDLHQQLKVWVSLNQQKWIKVAIGKKKLTRKPKSLVGWPSLKALKCFLVSEVHVASHCFVTSCTGWAHVQSPYGEVIHCSVARHLNNSKNLYEMCMSFGRQSYFCTLFINLINQLFTVAMQVLHIVHIISLNSYIICVQHRDILIHCTVSVSTTTTPTVAVWKLQQEQYATYKKNL